jgi:hypothetical protein
MFEHLYTDMRVTFQHFEVPLNESEEGMQRELRKTLILAGRGEKK